MFSLKIMGVMGVVLAVLLGGFYWYYTDSQDRLATLQANAAKLETAVQLQTDTINSLQSSYKRAATEIMSVNSALSEARTQNSELQLKLSKHDLGMLALTKPGLVQRTVNIATANASRCLELLSGAALNDKERTATNGKQFNSECPWLYDTLGVSR